jgi:DNA-binding response OmpR family regulator
MHALIIEDQYLLAMALEDALRELGYGSFDIATSVTAAITAAEGRCPDLIVADHRLDSGTGTEAVRRICAGKTIPVIFVTGSGDEVLSELPLAIIVEKPLTHGALGPAVARAQAQPYCGD